MRLPSSMADFVPCERFLQKAHIIHEVVANIPWQGKMSSTVYQHSGGLI